MSNTTTIFSSLLLAALLWLTACSAPDTRLPVTGTADGAAAAAFVLVDEPGVYRVTSGDLAPLNWGDVDPATLRLRYQGDDYPFWVQPDGDGFTLLFYADPVRHEHSPVDSYRLERASDANDGTPPTPITTDATTAATVPASQSTNTYTATLHLEENTHYEAEVETGDRWLWHELRAPSSFDVPFTLTNVADGDARLTLELWSNTEAPADPDHHLTVSLNGTPLGDEQWDGTGTHTLTLDVPAAVLSDGEHTLTLTQPGIPDVAVEITSLASVTLAYPRALTANDGSLTFASDGRYHTPAGIDSDALVFDVSDPTAAQFVTTLQPGTSFAGDAGNRYAVVATDALRTPHALSVANATPDLTTANGDYLVIAPRDLLPATAPLQAWRSEQGLQVAAVAVEDVYNQFGAGIRDPAAIRELLRYAAANWDTPPRYVLLVGDYSYDPYAHSIDAAINQMPTFMHYTVFGGATASDVEFALLDDDDDLPDLAVGRIPARTPEQLATVIERTIAYEQEPPRGDWTQRVTAFADTQEARFNGDAMRFLERFGADYESVLVGNQVAASVVPTATPITQTGAGEADGNPPAGITPADVQAAMNDGALLTAYFGHGSVTQLGRDSYLSVADIGNLTNDGHPPVMLHFTCLTGLFIHPEVESLSEAMLWDADGGAVAILAPTSRTLPDDQGFLAEGFADEHIANRDARIGDLLLAAWRNVPQHSPAAVDVGRTFLLFGDPALRLPTSTASTE